MKYFILTAALFVIVIAISSSNIHDQIGFYFLDSKDEPFIYEVKNTSLQPHRNPQKDIANRKKSNSLIETTNTKIHKSTSIKKEKKINEEYKQYQSNLDCFAYFEHNSEEKIVSYLIDKANQNSEYTTEELIDIKNYMRKRLYKCKKIVGDKTELQFEKYTFELLKIAAESGYDKAQVTLALSYSNMSILERYSDDESNILYNKSLKYLNKASNQGSADAKVYLALMYLDPIL